MKENYHIIHGEEVECSMIAQTNAVHDPRTMMVHLQRTLLANRAVMSSSWFPPITLMTRLGILVWVYDYIPYTMDPYLSYREVEEVYL